jgi:NAD(P)-dependent dehydrogenase (short-subunit alcohol dehydrogenase family)
MSTIVITGAGRGIGLEMARQYLRDGDRVIATVRSPDHAQTLNALGAQTFFVEMADPQSIAAFGQAMAHESIDVLIVNAGIMRQRDMRFSGIDVAAWQECFQVNCIAPALLAGYLLAPIRRGAVRKMIALSSGRASIARNTTGSVLMYRASKTALNATWKTLACDEPDITALLIHPGRVRTSMGLAEAELSPEESATAVRQVIARCGPQDSGRFLNYAGETMPW